MPCTVDITDGSSMSQFVCVTIKMMHMNSVRFAIANDVGNVTYVNYITWAACHLLKHTVVALVTLRHFDIKTNI